MTDTVSGTPVSVAVAFVWPPHAQAKRTATAATDSATPLDVSVGEFTDEAPSPNDAAWKGAAKAVA